MEQRPPLLAIALISCAALGYEVLLMQLLAIIHWHHFAFMVVSVALLGIGVSGTVITLWQDSLLKNFQRCFFIASVCLALAIPLCFATAQHIAFNPLEILWNPVQWWHLCKLYLLLFIPFFLAASCIGLSLRRFSHNRLSLSGKIYGCDLLGAGAGALMSALLLFVVAPAGALRLLGIIALLGATSVYLVPSRFTLLKRRQGYRHIALLMMAAAIIAYLPEHWLTPRHGEFKDLAQTLRLPGTAITHTIYSPLGEMMVTEHTQVPLRHAPGSSLLGSQEPPPQRGIFHNGESRGALTRFNGERDSLSYLDQTTGALAYHLLNASYALNSSKTQAGIRVLILGAGDGSEILRAHYHNANQVDAVSADPEPSRLMQTGLNNFSGWQYLAPTVRWHLASPRAFINRNDTPYNLIILPLTGATGTVANGALALQENYLYTREALYTYWSNTSPQGLIALNLWAKTPPRDSLKLWHLALVTLESLDIQNPEQHLAMIRGWNTTTLLMKRTPFSENDIATLKNFCRQRAFDPVYFHGISASDVNRHNLTEGAPYYHGALALLGAGRGDFLKRYKFDLRSPSDEQPYFFQFFKWSSSVEFLQLRQRGGLALLQWGYPTLLITLLQTLATSTLLILLPLTLKSSFTRLEHPDHKLSLTPARVSKRSYKWLILAYFFGIGIAYLFIEIVFMQKFTLYLGHPLYAIAVVLAGFLLFSGAGSLATASRWRLSPLHIGISLTLLTLLYLWLLPLVFTQFIGLTVFLKIAFSLLLIAPLAFLMGMFFPLGIGLLEQQQPDLIPWAWGINGCASVISPILATLLSLHWGFPTVLIAAAVLYLALSVALKKVASTTA